MNRLTPALQRLLAFVIAAVLVSGVTTALIIAPEKTSAQIAVEEGMRDDGTDGSGDADDGANTSVAASPGEVPNQSGADVSATPSNPGSASPSGSVDSSMPSTAKQKVTGDQVSVIGDSVTLAAKSKLTKALPGVDVDGKVSRAAPQGLEMINSWSKSGRLRPYVVIALATNTNLSQSMGEKIISAVGDRKLVFVTGYGPRSDDWIWQSNQTIKSLALKYPDKVQVADWAEAIKPHPDYLAKDSTHPDGRGAAIFAATVVDALNRFP